MTHFLIRMGHFNLSVPTDKNLAVSPDAIKSEMGVGASFSDYRLAAKQTLFEEKKAPPYVLSEEEFFAAMGAIWKSATADGFHHILVGECDGVERVMQEGWGGHAGDVLRGEQYMRGALGGMAALELLDDVDYRPVKYRRLFAVARTGELTLAEYDDGRPPERYHTDIFLDYRHENDLRPKIWLIDKVNDEPAG